MTTRDPLIVDSATPEHLRRARRQNAAFLLAVLGALLFALYPGRFDGDSVSQHQMGMTFQFHDWHSPMMSAALGFLSDLGPGTAPMFVVQLVIWIIGLGLLTDTVIAQGHPVAGQAMSVISAMPLASFNFLEVQKDSLFTALVAVIVAMGVRGLYRARTPTVLGVLGSFLIFAFALDVRTNGFFLLAGLLCLYFPVRTFTRWSVIRTAVLCTVVLGLGFVVTGWVDRAVLKASRTNSLYSLLVFDLAGISFYAQADASQGLLPDFAGAAGRCYTPTGADPFLWGDCNIRERLAGLMQAEESRAGFEWQWIKAIVTNPGPYLTHRLHHFSCYIRVGCGDFRWPMSPGLRFNRGFESDPRVSRLGLFMEAVAMKSYAGPMMNGGLLMLLLAVEIGAMAAVLRRGFAVLPYATLVVAASALVYELAFVIVGVSAAQRYVHVVVFMTGLTVPLAIASLRTRDAARPDA